MPETAVAVVTGGSGRIGSAICTTLARNGFAVVVGYHRSADTAADLVSSLPGSGHWAAPAPVDNTAAIEALASQVSERYGRCDVLVNCAGTTRFVPHAQLRDLDDELIDRILATNVRGSFAAIRAFVDLLRASTLHGGGVVVNISSVAARTAMGSNVMYCASKAALDNLTMSLARALAPHVRVISVSPGLVDTDFVKSLDPQWRRQQEAATPLERLATADEVGTAVLCAVRELTFTTGSVIAVDGGRPLV